VKLALWVIKREELLFSSVDDTVLIEISRSKIENLIKNNPKLEKVLLNYYQKRILDLLLAINPVFEPISPEIRQELIKRFNLIKIPPKSLIIREGDSSDSMYLIKTGEVKVFKEKEGEILEIARLGPGDFFGEIGLITGQKRTASIMSETNVELMELKKEDIDFIISKYPEILATLKEYIKQRTSDTFSKLMELKKLSAKKGLV
jgi:CRP-like cAMP-binding protein